ncbi:MAG: YifB family Mg chelatase-like AAA ATPase [Neomegalonema sp.]|nr:YifB family Mg chelatase-like AAA ATPase [Neomegalonema sp.]
MVAHAYTVAFSGLEARLVDVQCQLSSGVPAFTIVGLPDKAVTESRERVRAALNAMGLALPAKRITVNLSPADLPKEGAHYDLPIALALLAAMEAIPQDEPAHYLAMGELSLDGSLIAVPGALPAALSAAETARGFICPEANGPEAALVGLTQVVAGADLLSLTNHFNGRTALPQPTPRAAPPLAGAPDLREVRGQESAKRALEIAAAGGHNLLMIGPPGAGKSMLAARAPGILPPLSPEEGLEVGMIHSIADLLQDGAPPQLRPYRAPHHSASMAAMVGGGRNAKPGEVSLAHRGVLFLDELPEFARPVLEALRQPLESGEAIVARVNAHARYPARVQLIAAMNPCRCGYLGDPTQACSRAPKCGLDYQSRLSGPLLDRIDIQIEMAAATPSEMRLPPAQEGSSDVAARVATARAQQKARFVETGFPHLTLNAEADGEALDAVSHADEDALDLLTLAAEKMRLTARGYRRILRVARTIADLAGSETIRRPHVAEAARLRRTPISR